MYWLLFKREEDVADRAGRHLQVMNTFLCGFIWSYIHIIARLYMNEITNINETTSQNPSVQLLSLDDYRRQSISDLNEFLIGLILPEECIN